MTWTRPDNVERSPVILGRVKKIYISTYSNNVDKCNREVILIVAEVSINPIAHPVLGGKQWQIFHPGANRIITQYLPRDHPADSLPRGAARRKAKVAAGFPQF